jgi:hypothetical protein
MSDRPIEIDIDELILADEGVDGRELEAAIEAELDALRADPGVGAGPDSGSEPAARRIARSVLARLEHGESGGGGDP